MITIPLNSCKKTVYTVVIFYIAFVIFLFFFQRNLQYVPFGVVGTPEDYHLNGVNIEKLNASDGTNLLSWYKEPDRGKKVILYFQGNAGNLGGRSFKFHNFINNGFGFLAISYRGYSGSEGDPSEEGLKMDADAALKFLFDKGYKPQDIIVYGESLGSGLAVPLAAKHNFYAVVLEAPFTSAISVAKRRYWFAPVQWLLKDQYNSIESAALVKSPTLVFHKTRDKIVPYAEGEDLFAVIGSKNKEFETVQGVGHVNFDSEFLVDEIKKFIKGIR